MLVPLLFCRLYLELYFRLKEPMTSDQMLYCFLIGFRNNPDSFQNYLRKNESTLKERRLFRLALPKSICVDVYRGWRKEMGRQRKWVQALEGQSA